MKSLYRLFVLLLLIMLLAGTGFSQDHFVARLTGDQQVPSANSASKGTAAFTLTDDGLNYIITVDSMAGFSTAHFHLGAIGDTGSVVKTITSSFRGNVAVGVWNKTDSEPLSDDLIAALMNGKIHVIVATSANPNGEIRGQVIPASGTSFKSSLTGLQVVPGVITGATATATFLLTDVGLAYDISSTGLTGITGANLHVGAAGENGDIVKTLNFQGNKAAGIWMKSDAEPLTDRLILALLSDSLYVNVNTGANPNGELRGQIMQAGGHFFTAALNGSQEVPANNSTARGSGYFTLTKKGLVFAVTINFSEPVLAVNLVNAPAGMTGNIVKTLTPLLRGKSLSGVWGFNDATEPLTKEMISELLKGNIYINYYTSRFPNGEIRGQLNPANGIGFRTYLSSAQVNPPVTGSSKGVGNFTLTSEGLNYNITLETTDTLKSAHFYLGEMGQPVQYTSFYAKSVREFRNANANGTWRFVDTIDVLTPDFLEQLLKERVFILVRTRKDTLGAIRGHLHLTGGTALKAVLTGSQEVPKVNTPAYGTGNFMLTDLGLAYNITVDSIALASSHFHLAPIGQNGGVVKDISASFKNNTAKGFWPVAGGDQPLTGELMKALLTGKIYVNVHSPVYPNGEIRGQLLINDGWGFTASLNGFQAVPSNTSTAGGTGAFTFTPSGLIYDVSLTGITPSAFGIHSGPAAQSGDVVRDIFPELSGSKTVSGAWLIRGTETMSNDHINSLFNEGLYVNASSAAFPNGEIRGQIVQTVQQAVVSVKNTDNSVPREFSLGQNYPNPFNPSTTIKFAVPSFGPVELSVYNILGKRVVTLVNSDMPAGSYEVKFDASNLPSGIYIYRLQSGQNSDVRKMMLLK